MTDRPRAAAVRGRVAATPDPPRVTLPSGRTLEVERGPVERLTVRSPAGRVELAVRFTAEGPVLSFSSAEVEIASPGAVRVECESFAVKARDAITLEAGGDLAQDAAGRAELAAGAVRVVAREGDVALDARGDARVDGARVLLNCAEPGAR